MSKIKFNEICDMHTNPLIFKVSKDGFFEKYNDGTPILSETFQSLYK